MGCVTEHASNSTTNKVVTAPKPVTQETIAPQHLSLLSPVSPLKRAEILIRAYRGLDFRFVAGDVVPPVTPGVGRHAGLIGWSGWGAGTAWVATRRIFLAG
jgi:hypothetical protein